ncbi:MAG: helix-turn-helix transcriptional regulator [Rhodothermales bacterium]|nr:helix-turn-helix transcriptional regulator [Rhodothermales bacterium]
MARTFNRQRFGAALLAHRGDLSIRDAAEAAGVGAKTYHDAERGHTEPSVTTLGKLCAWLGRDIWDFFDVEEPVMPVLID